MYRAEALAKINRELRVGPRRADGYHETRSRLTTIDLADSIEVAPAPELSLEVDNWPPPPASEENLVVRAARALASRAGVCPGARIRLDKRIPVGAGLGGGSSDAAATLGLLVRLWGLEEREDELDLPSLAAGLGSDVPYFLTGGEADVAGRGERVAALPDGPPRELLILLPPFALSTARVYAALDARTTLPAVPDRLDVERSGKFFGPNDLALPVLVHEGRMENYLESATAAGKESGITGSGSAIVIGDFRLDAEGWLVKRHPEAKVFRCRTVGRAEYRRRINPSGGLSWR